MYNILYTIDMKNSNVILHLNELSLLEKVEVIWVILLLSEPTTIPLIN